MALVLAEDSRGLIRLRDQNIAAKGMRRALRLVLGNIVGAIGVVVGVAGWCVQVVVLMGVGVCHALLPVSIWGIRAPSHKNIAAWWRAWGVAPRTPGFSETDALFAVTAGVAALYGCDAAAKLNLHGRVQCQRARNAEAWAGFLGIGAHVHFRDPLESVIDEVSDELGPYASGGDE